MSDETLEARFAALKQRAKDEFGTDLNMALTIGGVKVDRLYRLRPLDDAETLDEHLTTIERVIELPSFRAVAHAEAHLTSIETALQLAETVYAARLSEYNTAREQFDLDTNKDATPEVRNGIQDSVEHIVQAEADDLEEDLEERAQAVADEKIAEANPPEDDIPQADWPGEEPES